MVHQGDVHFIFCFP